VLGAVANGVDADLKFWRFTIFTIGAFGGSFPRIWRPFVPGAMISPMKSEGPMWSGWQPKLWRWLNSEVTVSECLGMFLRLQMLGTDSSNGLMQKTSRKDGNEHPRILRDIV
jgi:hypothetical protein